MRRLTSSRASIFLLTSSTQNHTLTHCRLATGPAEGSVGVRGSVDSFNLLLQQLSWPTQVLFISAPPGGHLLAQLSPFPEGKAEAQRGRAYKFTQPRKRPILPAFRSWKSDLGKAWSTDGWFMAQKQREWQLWGGRGQLGCTNTCWPLSEHLDHVWQCRERGLLQGKQRYQTE